MSGEGVEKKAFEYKGILGLATKKDGELKSIDYYDPKKHEVQSMNKFVDEELKAQYKEQIKNNKYDELFEAMLIKDLKESFGHTDYKAIEEITKAKESIEADGFNTLDKNPDYLKWALQVINYY